MKSGGRIHRWGATLLVVLVLSALGAPAGVADPLHQAKGQLSVLQQRIKERRAKLQHLDREMNRTASKIDRTQSALAEIQKELDRVAKHLAIARAQYEKLRTQMNARIRAAYIQGPGGPIELVLTAPSYNDLVERLDILEHMTQTDAELAAQIRSVATDLRTRSQDLTDLEARRNALLDQLSARRQELQSRFAEQHRLLAYLAKQKAQVVAQISTLQPFAVCPVKGPHAFSDDFGAPRFAGGYHPHAGNDILSPYGTPIVAPFDGKATASHDTLGGLTVVVAGANGYVYNAHLSRIAKTGDVKAGDLIGYVGNSGDARGGAPHDHFEWHPNTIPASPHKSPYGYT
ncbi:MAG: peptidoglycan DD-metalloendopeptidase family protein, partial [Actinomycetota bacterium]|nr:peptidoglycan DD-metalloendopeptidase family protein [Actinomycetota bacterium]